MKLHKWKTIKKRIGNSGEEKEEDISSFKDIIKIMEIYPQISSSLSSSDARIQLDSEHNK